MGVQHSGPDNDAGNVANGPSIEALALSPFNCGEMPPIFYPIREEISDNCLGQRNLGKKQKIKYITGHTEQKTKH